MRKLMMVCALAGAVHGETLAELQARMDQAAVGFKGMTAKLQRQSYTAVIKDLTDERGRIAIRRQKAEMQVRVDFTAPDEKTWVFRGRKAELFIPKINTVQEYDLGKHGKLIDQFLLLGFGSSAKELARSYQMRLAGEESVDGQKCSKLELIPKSAEALQHLKKVEIWFPPGSGMPAQQKFYLNAGDYMVVKYVEAKADANLPETAVRLQLPGNVKREFPQK